MSTLLDDLLQAQADFFKQMHDRDRSREKPLPSPKSPTLDSDASYAHLIECRDVSTNQQNISNEGFGEEFEDIYARRALFEQAKRNIDSSVKELFYANKTASFKADALRQFSILMQQARKVLIEIEEYGDLSDSKAIDLLRVCVEKLEGISRSHDKETLSIFTTEIIGQYFAPIHRHQKKLLQQLKQIKQRSQV